MKLEERKFYDELYPKRKILFLEAFNVMMVLIVFWTLPQFYTNSMRLLSLVTILLLLIAVYERIIFWIKARVYYKMKKTYALILSSLMSVFIIILDNNLTSLWSL
ncbi:hypothetical protein, partial [Lentilactobacillus farraginis]|uniref:hypothetical protein n=1 Tax=Lentilactobacillus farraginis TaxID=390841 RepID=UPI0005595057